jgi:hypothetical protein
MRPTSGTLGKQLWEVLGAATEEEETKKATEKTTAELEEHDDPLDGGTVNPATATGIKSKSKSTTNHTVMKFIGSTRLPEGSKVTGLVLHVYGKAANTEKEKFKLEVPGGYLTAYIEATSTAWRHFTASLSEAQEATLSTLLIGVNDFLEVEASQLSSVTARSEIFKWYILVTYTEPSAVPKMSMVV